MRRVLGARHAAAGVPSPHCIYCTSTYRTPCNGLPLLMRIDWRGICPIAQASKSTDLIVTLTLANFPPPFPLFSFRFHSLFGRIRYELATRQILQACSGRGCRGFRDFEVPLLMITISDGLTIESGLPLTTALRPYYRPEVTMVRTRTRTRTLLTCYVHACVAQYG